MRNTVLSKFLHKLTTLKGMLVNAYSMENIFLYLMAKKSYKRYSKIEFGKIRENIKESDTVVIYGTGRSILDITPERWEQLSKYNSISIGSFAQFNKYVNIDINHFREIGSYNFIHNNSRVANWSEMLDYAKNVNDTSFGDGTVHLFQSGIPANASNRFVYSELLNFDSKYSTYTSNRNHSGKLGKNYSVLSHINGSLGEAINIAYQLKWKKIILAGIDLVDRQYFFLEKNETVIWDLCRGEDSNSRHNMADSTIKHMSSIKSQLENDGVELFILNDKSLLAPILPVFK